MFGGSFAPAGWMTCEGQLVPIAEQETLFNLIGTTYGGDGQSTFALPNLCGRVPLHQGTLSGTTYVMGETGGVEQVTLTTQQIPVHTHPLTCSSGGATDGSPLNNVLAEQLAVSGYQSTNAAVAMAPNITSIVGGSQPHENMQPYLCIMYIISLYGVFPSPP
jgi:microcystin-dependent protein